MARIAGVNLPDNKRIETALTYIYGIGPSLAQKILGVVKIDPNIRVNVLPIDDLNRLRDYVEKNFKIEGVLRQEKSFNIKRLRDIGSYRGIRHSRGLPVRGQQTKTNSRTIRGNVRRTVGSGRKASTEKT